MEIELTPILVTQTGKRVLIEGHSINSEEALEIAQKLFESFGLQQERVTRRLMYEVRPLHWADCPHFEVGEEDRVREFINEGS
jgi:hypothetical protein